MNGFLYDQGNYIELASKIQYAIENWEKCVDIIEEAYKEAMEKYSIKRCANEVYEVYEKLLKEDENV